MSVHSAETATSVEAPRRGTFTLRSLSSDAAVVVGSSVLANACSYVFHFVLSRRLGPELYGTLATMIAISTILVVIGTSFGVVVMQETARLWVAHLDRSMPAFLRYTAVRVVGLAGAIALLIGLLAQPLGAFFHVPDPRLWWLLAIYVGVIVFAAFARGAPQGSHRFALFGGSLVVEGVGKVVLATLFVALGFRVGGALWGLICAAVLGIGIAFLPMVIGGDPTLAAGEAPPLNGRVIKVFGVASAMSALLYVDMLFAKHHFDAAQAGFFGAAGTVARTIPYGAGLVMPILGPLAAAAKHAGGSSLRRILGLVALSAAGAIAIGLTTISLLPHLLIHLTYGAQFAPAVPILRLYALDEALLAANILAATYLVAIGEYRVFLYLLGGVVLQATFMAAMGSTPVRLLTIAIILNAALAPAVWSLAVSSLHTAAPSPADRDRASRWRASDSWFRRLMITAVKLVAQPSLVINSIREHGIVGFVRRVIGSGRAGFKRQLEYVAVATMGTTPESIARACAAFVDDVQEYDEFTLLVRLSTGERFLIRRASCDKDIWLLWETYCYAESLASYDVRGKVVLDIGANLGDTAVYYGLRGAHVFAWEPSAELAELARRNCELNGVQADINAQGIGDCNRTLVLRNTGATADFASSTAFPGFDTNLRTTFGRGSEENIEVVSFADVLERLADVYLVKMNCEGCEYPSLMSLSDAQLRKVAHYIVDCHAEPDAIVQRFQTGGYKVRRPEGSPLFADRI